jgi:hypothetical protein
VRAKKHEFAPPVPSPRTRRRRPSRAAARVEPGDRAIVGGLTQGPRAVRTGRDGRQRLANNGRQAELAGDEGDDAGFRA